VHCSSIARFEQGYKEIARKLKLPGLEDPETNVVKCVFDWLSDEDNGSWLLVLDNADDKEIFFGSARRSQSQDGLQQQLSKLAQYLPQSAYGSTLITTRDRRIGEKFAERDQPIIVPPLEVADATSMLRSRLPNHLDWRPAEVAELLQSLQYLPLAIAQAASYISEEEIALKEYLELFRSEDADSKYMLEQDYYDSSSHSDMRNSVFQTWKISFDQIQHQAPRAAEILSLMSMLNKQSIPARLLQDEEESFVTFNKALQTLKNFSLIHEEQAQNTYGIHQLVQLSMQWWLNQEKTLTRWQGKALEVLFKNCPSSHSIEDWKAWQTISPHVTIVRGYRFQRAEQKLQYANITSRLGGYYKALGWYEMALKMEEDALNIRLELLGENHRDTLTSMNHLANVLSDQGKFKQAEEMHRQALGLRKVVLGQEHPETLTSMSNLGLVLSRQAKYAEAESVHRQLLRLRERVLGKEDPSTLTSMNNLAAVLSDQGQNEEAEEIHRRVLWLMERALSKEHPPTERSKNNLAWVSAASQEEQRSVVRTARLAPDERTVRSKNVSSERRDVSIRPEPATGETELPSAAPLWYPLGPQQFRLLHRNGKGELQLQLKTHRIDLAPRYRALSYACGTKPKDRSVWCGTRDGTSRALLKITQTLYDALKELAIAEIPIWVDAICIDQTNLEEKSKQVALMHRIYRRADEVAIWLDRHWDDNTILAMDILSWISRPPPISSVDERLKFLPALKRRLEQPWHSKALQVEQLVKLASVISKSQHIRISRTEFHRIGIPDFDDPLWLALGIVFSRPWLFRLWTFQELMLGKECFVAIGDSKLQWRTYFDVGMQLSLCGLLDHCIAHLPADRKARALTAFTRLGPFLNSSQKVVPFWRCLEEARQREVTETVDRIYAVLSLADETLRSKITLNYSENGQANYRNLFLEVGKAVMMTSTSQALLAGTNSKTKAKELPSWCPDFRVPCEVIPFGANARAGMQYPRSILPHYDKKVINIGGAKIDKVGHIVSFPCSWPQRDISEIYGPDGVAAQILRWLDTCWLFTREAYTENEAGAGYAFVMTILGEIPQSYPPQSKPRPPSTPRLKSLSTLAVEFVNIEKLDFSKYWEFLAAHRNFTEEDHELFLVHAARALGNNDEEVAARCVERAVFLIKYRTRPDGLDCQQYLEYLMVEGSELRNSFLDEFETLLKRANFEAYTASRQTAKLISDPKAAHPSRESSPGGLLEARDAFFYETWFNEKDKILTNVRERLENLQTCAGPEDSDDSSGAWHRFQPIFQKLGDIWRNRVFFTTKKGKIGFASDRISPFDHVCVFFGESHLYILRDRRAGFYEFVSDAYVDGYITGQGCENLDSNEIVFKLN
jgi:tetratricopeptide (TPR) repeat protein